MDIDRFQNYIGYNAQQLKTIKKKYEIHLENIDSYTV